MADTKLLEYVALYLIAHKLLREGILVAFPSFDRNGADLLLLANVGSGAKFCKAQSKYRSLINTPSTSIEIPAAHVSENLIVFLFVDEGEPSTDRLYCFFAEDVAEWPKGPAGEHRLPISRASYRDALKSFELSQTAIKRIKEVLERIDPTRELSALLQVDPGSAGGGNVVYEDPRIRVTVQQSPGGWMTLILDKATTTVSTGPTPPSDPSSCDFDPATRTWRARS